MLEILGLFLQAAAGHVLYLALHLESGSFPRPLTPAKEREAFAALRAGGPDAAAARDRLIRHNLRLVAHVTKKYYAATAAQDDLISIGTIGLIKAINTFNPNKNLRPGAGQQVFQLCEPLHRKRTAHGTAPHPARGQPGIVTGTAGGRQRAAHAGRYAA